MGVIDARRLHVVHPIPPGDQQDLLLRAATEEVQDKGFVVANARQAGQLGAQRFAVADDLWAGLLRRRDDAYRRQPL